MDVVNIADKCIGTGHPAFIIAEAGVNHNGDVDTAMQLIDAAVEAKADAVKFQCFHSALLTTNTAPMAAYQKTNTGLSTSQQAMLEKLELSDGQFEKLYHYCNDRGILFLATPFDTLSADFLFHLGVAAFKIGSGDLNNVPLLTHIARMKKPMLLSTGMSGIDDVTATVSMLRKQRMRQIVLLHCVSNYPAAPRDVNLRAMDTIAKKCKCPVGFSDHTSGIEIAIGAAARGACVIEKHVTLNRNATGPDHKASLEPRELAAMIYAVRNVEMAIGDGCKKIRQSEKAMAEIAKRSLFAARSIHKGQTIQACDIAILRPGIGLNPGVLPSLIGKQTQTEICSGELLTMEMFK